MLRLALDARGWGCRRTGHEERLRRRSTEDAVFTGVGERDPGLQRRVQAIQAEDGFVRRRSAGLPAWERFAAVFPMLRQFPRGAGRRGGHGAGFRRDRGQMTRGGRRRLGVIVLLTAALQRTRAIVAVPRTGRLRLAKPMDQRLPRHKSRAQQQGCDDSPELEARCHLIVGSVHETEWLLLHRTRTIPPRARVGPSVPTV